MRFAAASMLALGMAVAVSVSDASDVNLLKPVVREVGDELYTTVSGLGVNKTEDAKVAAVKAAVSDKAHDISGAVYSAADPLGAALLTKFHAVDDALFEKRTPGCKKALIPPKPPGAYAFLGSGNLLPYYQGIVQALQDRGVLTPEVLRTAKFSGFSGGSLTAVLTALGWPGHKQFELYEAIFAAVAACLAAATTPAERLECTLNGIGIPLVRDALAGTDVPAIINGRTSLWACQLNAMSTTLDGSVAMGTTKWTSNDDVLANVMVSDQIPCTTTNTFYNLFRGAPYIDGGYCTDFKQLCWKDEAKCLKMSTEFLTFRNLPEGTPIPTPENCPLGVVPWKYLPRVDKPYYTPADQSKWTLPRGSCLSEADKAAVNVHPLHVPQGVTARPDIHPAFYAPLPPEFQDGCAWLQSGLIPVETPGGDFSAGLNATFHHGYQSGAGWADENGFCG